MVAQHWPNHPANPRSARPVQPLIHQPRVQSLSPDAASSIERASLRLERCPPLWISHQGQRQQWHLPCAGRRVPPTPPMPVISATRGRHRRRGIVVPQSATGPPTIQIEQDLSPSQRGTQPCPRIEGTRTVGRFSTWMPNDLRRNFEAVARAREHRESQAQQEYEDHLAPDKRGKSGRMPFGKSAPWWRTFASTR